MNAHDDYPVRGLRILAVDDDETDLEALRTALRALNYQVTTCSSHDEAMSLLFREGGLEFSAVVANIDWQIGFQLVEYVGLKMNLPIIVTCSVEDKRLVAHAINHGAHHGLMKPPLIDKLWQIWQFVLAHRRWRVVGNRESTGEEEGGQFSGNDGGTRGCKIRECDCDDGRQLHSHGNLVMTSRMVWTEEMNRRFVEIYERLGDKKATPKKILALMGVPFLTKEHISSHLQKYRLALKKKMKDAAASASAPQGRKNSKSSGAKSSNAKRGIVINEPAPISNKDIAQQLPPYSNSNVASLPIVSSLGPRFSFGNTSVRPYFHRPGSSAAGMRPMTSYKRSDQLSFRCSGGASDGLPGRTLRIHQPIMNEGIVISSQVLDHGLPLERPTRGFAELPNSYFLSPGHRGVTWTPPNEQMFGATQEIGESSHRNRNEQGNGTENPVGNGVPNVDKFHVNSTAMTTAGEEVLKQGSSAERTRAGSGKGLGREPRGNLGGM